MAHKSEELCRREKWLRNQREVWPLDADHYHSEAIECLRSAPQLGPMWPIVCNQAVNQTLKANRYQPDHKMRHQKKKIINAIQGLQRMCANLLVYPWKDQFASINTISAFFFYTLRQLSQYERILQAMGYTEETQGDELLWRLKDSDKQKRRTPEELKILLIDLVAAEEAIKVNMGGDTSGLSTYTKDPQLSPGQPGVVCQTCRHISASAPTVLQPGGSVDVGDGFSQPSQLCTKCGKAANQTGETRATYL